MWKRGRGERRTVLGKEQLVDDDVVRVDFVRRQLLYETFRLIEGQEFGYADADKRGLFLRSGATLFTTMTRVATHLLDP